uniref:DUF659 domain-containing protein n=1 Tax=Globodera rostochiensis TaxID=31243 RepID=A0A914HSA2_GLORO
MPKIKSKSAWMRDWINRIDGKTTYTTDGTIVYCQPCQQQVENQPFSSRQQQQQDNENNLQRTFPSRMTLHNHLGICYEQKMDELKKEFSGKQIWASVDETTDKKGRYVANLIIGVLDCKLNKPVLVAVKYLEKTNNETIACFVNDNLRTFISAENLLLFVTDGARYMIKAAKGLKMFYPNLIHLTCVCHGLNRVCEAIRAHFVDVDELIASTKKVFSKAPSRVAKFRELCDLPLPPRPIITRWATWLRAALYYSEHFDQIGAIVECFNQNDSDAIKKSQISFKIPNVQADLAFIRANFHYLPDAIEKLEARDLLLVESLDILADVGNEINLVPGPVGKVMQEKFGNVLLNNPGFDQMREIGMVLRGEHVQMHLPPDVIAKFKYGNCKNNC